MKKSSVLTVIMPAVTHGKESFLRSVPKTKKPGSGFIWERKAVEKNLEFDKQSDATFNNIIVGIKKMRTINRVFMNPKKNGANKPIKIGAAKAPMIGKAKEAFCSAARCLLVVIFFPGNSRNSRSKAKGGEMIFHLFLPEAYRQK